MVDLLEILGVERLHLREHLGGFTGYYAVVGKPILLDHLVENFYALGGPILRLLWHLYFNVHANLSVHILAGII